MGKKKDSFDRWLESDAAAPPTEPRTHNGMTDRELSAAICRVAIKEGLDPVKEGVIPSAAVMDEEDSEELAYKNQLKANLALTLAKQFGVSTSAAQAALVTRGTIVGGPDENPVDQAVMDLMLDSEEVQDLVFDGLPVEGSVDLRALRQDSDLEVFAAFVRKVEQYDTWLRPFAVFIGSLMFAVGAGLSAGSTLLFMVMAYGLICGGFKPKQKALKEADQKKC